MASSATTAASDGKVNTCKVWQHDPHACHATPHLPKLGAGPRDLCRVVGEGQASSVRSKRKKERVRTGHRLRALPSPRGQLGIEFGASSLCSLPAIHAAGVPPAAVLQVHACSSPRHGFTHNGNPETGCSPSRPAARIAHRLDADKDAAAAVKTQDDGSKQLVAVA